MSTFMALCAILPALIIILASGLKIERKPVSAPVSLRKDVLIANAAPSELTASHADHPVATKRVVSYSIPRLLW